VATQFAALARKAAQERHATVNEMLEGMYGGKEGVDSHKEMVEKMFATEGGLTGQEVEQLADELAKAGLYSSPLLTRALFNLSKTVVTEGDTEPGGGGGKKKMTLEERQNKQLPVITGALGWKK
jgi:hypothetical protein